MKRSSTILQKIKSGFKSLSGNSKPKPAKKAVEPKKEAAKAGEFRLLFVLICTPDFRYWTVFQIYITLAPAVAATDAATKRKSFTWFFFIGCII